MSVRANALHSRPFERVDQRKVAVRIGGSKQPNCWIRVEGKRADKIRTDLAITKLFPAEPEERIAFQVPEAYGRSAVSYGQHALF